PIFDVLAGIALAAGFGRGATLAVERLGEDARDGGLADAAGAGEQERMVDAAGIERIAQRAHHVLLPDPFGEAPGAPLAGEDEIGHRDPWLSGGGGIAGADAPRSRSRHCATAIAQHPRPGTSPLSTAPATARICGPVGGRMPHSGLRGPGAERCPSG